MIDAPETASAQPSAWPARLPWHDRALADALAGRARWPHALLMTGPAGIGKRRLALEFARALLCETPHDDGSACGACDGCRYVAAGQHPDLRRVEPFQIEEDGTATPTDWIGIDAIRDLIRWVQLTSHRRGAKVAVIVPAERMKFEAANALLKTLEEPPAGSYLILVADQPGRLPATVRSRCRPMHAPVPEATEALAWLSAQGIADASPLLAQSGGAPLAAIALANPDYQAERDAWLRALAAPGKLAPATLAARIDDAPREARRERLTSAIDWMLSWCVDLARVRAGGAPRTGADFAAALAALAPAVAPITLFRYHRRLVHRRALSAHPLAPRLVAEALLFEYLTLFR